MTTFSTNFLEVAPGKVFIPVEILTSLISQSSCKDVNLTLSTLTICPREVRANKNGKIRKKTDRERYIVGTQNNNPKHT